MNGSVFSAAPRGTRMGHLGAVPIAGAPRFQRVVALGQEQQPPPPPVEAPREPPTPRGRARAWGQLKKLEAQELMAALKDVEERMGALKMPPGIVTAIGDRLQNFIENAAPDDTFEMTEEEMAGLDAAFLAVETQEQQQKTSRSILTVLGIGIVATVVAVSL